MNQNMTNLPPLTGEQDFPDQINPERNYKFPNPNDEEKNKDDLILSELAKGILSFKEFEKFSTPPRVPVLGSWFNEGNYGLIFAKAGVGKTWLSLHMAQSIAEGKDCGPWACHKPRRVLYVDGEMPGASLKSRYSGLRLDESDSSAENIFFLTHETPWPKELGKRIDLKKEPTQRAILKHCQKNQIEVVFLDNLSCLFRRVKENEADDWENPADWILDFKESGVAVVLVLHSNRTGNNPRGTSRREDDATWTIQLKKTDDSKLGEGEGAKFVAKFTKNREGSRDETHDLVFRYKPYGTKTEVTYERLGLIDIFKQYLAIPEMDTCKAITTAMCSDGHNVNAVQVSRFAKKGEEEGWLKKKGEGRGTRYEPSNHQDRI